MTAPGPSDERLEVAARGTRHPGPDHPVAEDRIAWSDAVWAADMKPTDKLVALAFARYASKGSEGVWVTMPTLLSDTGLSKTAAYEALGRLRGSGWLYQAEEARQHRSPRYTLTIPSGPGDGPLSAGDVIHRAEPSGPGDGPLDRQGSARRNSEVREADPNHNTTRLTMNQSPTYVQSAAATRGGDGPSSFDLAAFRAKRPDLGYLSDDTAWSLAQETLGRARGAVRNETAYVLHAALDPEWANRGIDREWSTFAAVGAVAGGF